MATQNPDKAQILADLKQMLGAELAAMQSSQQSTVAGAIHEETRAEDAKDTRAIEQSYLARGQAKRVTELQLAVTQLEVLTLRDFTPDTPIGLTALVALVDEQEQRSWYFLAPAGGGLRLENAGQWVRVLTPVAPLGKAMLGKRSGDDFELSTPQGQRELYIEEVL